MHRGFRELWAGWHDPVICFRGGPPWNSLYTPRTRCSSPAGLNAQQHMHPLLLLLLPLLVGAEAPCFVSAQQTRYTGACACACGNRQKCWGLTSQWTFTLLLSATSNASIAFPPVGARITNSCAAFSFRAGQTVLNCSACCCSLHASPSIPHVSADNTR